MYSVLLLESGGHVLLETGFKLLLEDSEGNDPGQPSGNLRIPIEWPNDGITDEDVFAILALTAAHRR